MDHDGLPHLFLHEHILLRTYICLFDYFFYFNVSSSILNCLPLAKLFLSPFLVFFVHAVWLLLNRVKMTLALQSVSVADQGEDKVFVGPGVQNASFLFKVRMK